jgi:hypothetical protein
MKNGRNGERRNKRKLFMGLVIPQLVVEISQPTVLWAYTILRDAHARLNNMK